MQYTEIHGKRTLGKRANWIVRPRCKSGTQQEVEKLFASCPRNTFIRLRSDLDCMSPNQRRQHTQPLLDLEMHGFVTVALELQWDEESRQHVVVHALKMRPGDVEQVERRIVLRLLEPNSYGQLFEECNREGVPYFPVDVAQPLKQTPTAPPRPPMPPGANR